MTKQDIFDKVARHLLTQKVKSMKPRLTMDGEMCAYRGDSGTSCAVGCLIPDDLYDPKMEGNDAVGLFSRFPKVEKLLGKDNESLLSDLQRIHDSSLYRNESTITKWHRDLNSIAREYNLNPEVLKEFPNE